MPARTYLCDVCGKRFRVNENPEDSEREITCPRCRVPFVRPIGKRHGSPRNRTVQDADVPRCMAFS